MKNKLNMVRLSFNTRNVSLLLADQGLRGASLGDGYTVHCLLDQIFGGDSPKPFQVKTSKGGFSVIAYSPKTSDELRDTAMIFAEPRAYNACDWSRVASKPMPSTFSANKKVSFQVTVCPMIRASGRGRHRKNAEVDAFSLALDKSETPHLVCRESVYHDWLSKEFGRRGGMNLVSSKLLNFGVEGLLRKSQTGKRERNPGMVATMRGVLEVTDPLKFNQALARGLGRHRAFGLGMLCLTAAV